MALIIYSDGSFMRSWDKARAWYTPQGELKDAEHKLRYRGAPSSRAVKPNGPTWQYLAKQGKQVLYGRTGSVQALYQAEYGTEHPYKPGTFEQGQQDAKAGREAREDHSRAYYEGYAQVMRQASNDTGHDYEGPSYND